MKPNELLPCPFCGGPMTLKISRSNGHQIFGSHTKECAFSDISACMSEPTNCEWVADEIIARWNTRAQSAPAEVAQGETQRRPMAWFTDDYALDKSATTYDRAVAERWRVKGWPVTALYTAPPSPDAELVELLRLCRNDFAGVSMTHNLIGRIDAKLASLK